MILLLGVLAAGVVLCLWCVVRSGGKSDRNLENLMKDKKIAEDEGWVNRDVPDYSGVNIQNLGYEFSKEIMPVESSDEKTDSENDKSYEN